MSAGADRYAEWDAAYVLGGLSAAARLEFEDHLGGCAECGARVAELAGMPGILGRLDAAAAAALRDLPAEPATEGTGPIAHLARRVHRRRRAVALAGAAAVVVAATGGALLGSAGLAPAAAGMRLAPVAGSAVSAELTATAVPWGTRLSWSCTYPDGGAGYAPTGYRLVVTTREGAARTVATWAGHGDGASGLSAATSVPRSDIRSIDIRATDGEVLARAVLGG